MSYGIASTAHPATDPASHSQSTADLSSTGKLAIRSAIVAFLFLSQVAYNIGDFPLSVDFICYASCAAYLLVSGYVALDFLSFSLFSCAAALAALRNTILRFFHLLVIVTASSGAPDPLLLSA